MRICIEQAVAGADQCGTQGFADGYPGTELQVGDLRKWVQLCRFMDQHNTVEISADTPSFVSVYNGRQRNGDDCDYCRRQRPRWRKLRK